MSNMIFELAGAWPEGVEQRMQAIVADEVELMRETEAGRGALSWGDIGSLVQAGAAVVTVVLTLWQIRIAASNAKKEPTPASPQELTLVVRHEGLFGSEVNEVNEAEGGVQLHVAIRDSASGEVFRFSASRGQASRVSVRLER
jgi:hypothetical protein